MTLSILVYLFATGRILCYQHNEDLEFDVWNDLTIHPGVTLLTFISPFVGPGFISFSVHSPFNKIWASLSVNCPSDVSQYGFHIGLVNRQPYTNSSASLFVCSHYSDDCLIAVRASAYSAGYAVPGGCGISALPNFSVSTIVGKYDNRFWNRFAENKHYLNNNTTMDYLDFWTSTLNFYPVSVPSSEGRCCCYPTNNSNSTSSEDVIYHVYYLPLITSGGTSSTFLNPTTTDVLNVLSQISSSGDTMFHGSRLTSIKRSDLELKDDFSYSISVVRHLGTASVVNIIAEYQTSIPDNGISSTFVAYTPTVLYTCPSTDSDRFRTDVAFYSDKISCSLLSDSVRGTRFFVGLMMLFALLYTISGFYFVHLRCAISLMISFSFLSLLLAYRSSLLELSTMLLVVLGVLVPSLLSLFAMTLLWACCLRNSTNRPPRPIAHAHGDIFSRPLLASSVDLPTMFPGNFTLDDTTVPVVSSAQQQQSEYVENNEYGSIFTGDRHIGIGSSANLFSSVAALHPDLNSTQNSSLDSESADCRNVTCCSDNRQQKQFRLRRLARLPPVLPATFLLSSLVMLICSTFFSAFHRSEVYVGLSITLLLLLALLLAIYKNFAFGVSVSLVGLFVALSCFSLLFYPTCLLPYLLVDQFLILISPHRRLQTLQLPGYGRNDIIFLVVWLLVSATCGLITMCMLRFRDARDHAFSTMTWNNNFANTATVAPEFTRPPTKSRAHFGPYFRVPFLRSSSRQRTVTRSLDLRPVIEPENEPSSITEERSLLNGNSFWPPQPFTQRSSGPQNEHRVIVQRPRVHPNYGGVLDNPQPLVPLSRTQIAAVSNASASPHPNSHPSAQRENANDHEAQAFVQRAPHDINFLPPPSYFDVGLNSLT